MSHVLYHIIPCYWIKLGIYSTNHKFKGSNKQKHLMNCSESYSGFIRSRQMQTFLPLKVNLNNPTLSAMSNNGSTSPDFYCIVFLLCFGGGPQYAEDNWIEWKWPKKEQSFQLATGNLSQEKTFNLNTCCINFCT